MDPMGMGKPMLWGTHIPGHLQHGIFILRETSGNGSLAEPKNAMCTGCTGLKIPESISLDSLDSLSSRRQVQAQIHLAALPTLGDMFWHFSLTSGPAKASSNSGPVARLFLFSGVQVYTLSRSWIYKLIALVSTWPVIPVIAKHGYFQTWVWVEYGRIGVNKKYLSICIHLGGW